MVILLMTWLVVMYQPVPKSRLVQPLASKNQLFLSNQVELVNREKAKSTA